VRQFADAPHWKPRLCFWLLRGAHGVIALSSAIRSELLTAGFPDHKVFVIPNGVDVERFRPATASERTAAKQTLKLPADTLIIGTVARLERRKGIDILLRAFKRVLDDYPAHLLVIGDGPLGGELGALARTLQIDSSVSWLGLQPNPEKWLPAMDVFAFPSRLEGSPSAVLEAMAAGLPIVATTIGGVVDLIDKEITGILSPPNDPDGLAAALQRLIKDTSLRVDFSYRARARAVEFFAMEKTVSRMIDLYSNIAQQY
jgi:glycosyltransferase involved in cell wall biosynthesis